MLHRGIGNHDRAYALTHSRAHFESDFTRGCRAFCDLLAILIIFSLIVAPVCLLVAITLLLVCS